MGYFGPKNFIFWDHICPINMNENKIEKNNIKFKTRIKQCLPVPNFSQFGELLFWSQISPKKLFRMEYLDKCMQPENNLS